MYAGSDWRWHRGRINIDDSDVDGVAAVETNEIKEREAWLRPALHWVSIRVKIKEAKKEWKLYGYSLVGIAS